MNSYNQGLAYYRHYYDPGKWNFRTQGPKNLDKKKTKEDNQRAYFEKASKPLLKQQLSSDDTKLYQYSAIQDLENSIVLETTYPGLLLGSGYAHGVGDVQGEHKIGFYFDHTSGRPIIPGSSVKGTLRSVFPLSYDDKKERQGRSEYLRYLLTDPEVGINKEKAVIKDSFIEALERDIFDGLIPQNGDQQLVMPSRDIFHDGILSGPENQTFLGNDFITPHNKAGKNGIPAELRNPIPIQFLKILPGIQFTFQFCLPEKQYFREAKTQQLVERTEYLLTREQKIKLFKAILLDMGIGAKTNVGYGQLCDPNAPADHPSSCNYVPTIPDEVKEITSEDNELDVGHTDQATSSETANTEDIDDEIKPEFFRGSLSHKKRFLLDACVVKSGAVNQVEVYLTDGKTTIEPLTRYARPIDEGTVLKVYVQFKRNLTVNNVSYHDTKK